MQNLGPLSAIFCERLRPVMGNMLSFAGNVIHQFLMWLDVPKVTK